MRLARLWSLYISLQPHQPHQRGTLVTPDLDSHSRARSRGSAAAEETGTRENSLSIIHQAEWFQHCRRGPISTASIC